jgi:plasmid stabilization system protein ParE
MLSAAWIALDNPDAARRFLDAAFQAFESIARFPLASPQARLNHRRLRNVRYRVLPRPFGRWLVFYAVETEVVVIIRVLHGARNWREQADDLL